MPISMFLAVDGSEWSSYEDAQNHEKRLNLINTRLEEVGGFPGLKQLIEKPSSRASSPWSCSFVDEFISDSEMEEGRFVSRLAFELEEFVAFCKWLQPVLDECGPNSGLLRRM